MQYHYGVSLSTENVHVQDKTQVAYHILKPPCRSLTLRDIVQSNFHGLTFGYHQTPLDCCRKLWEHCQQNWVGPSVCYQHNYHSHEVDYFQNNLVVLWECSFHYSHHHICYPFYQMKFSLEIKFCIQINLTIIIMISAPSSRPT